MTSHMRKLGHVCSATGSRGQGDTSGARTEVSSVPGMKGPERNECVAEGWGPTGPSTPPLANLTSKARTPHHTVLPGRHWLRCSVVAMQVPCTPLLFMSAIALNALPQDHHQGAEPAPAVASRLESAEAPQEVPGDHLRCSQYPRLLIPHSQNRKGGGGGGGKAGKEAGKSGAWSAGARGPSWLRPSPADV